MAKLYPEIRAWLRTNRLTWEDFAEIIGRSKGYVTCRMNGSRPWDQDDMIVIVREMNWPIDKLHELFPPRPEGPQLPKPRPKEVFRRKQYIVRRRIAS